MSSRAVVGRAEVALGPVTSTTSETVVVRLEVSLERMREGEQTYSAQAGAELIVPRAVAAKWALLAWATPATRLSASDLADAAPAALDRLLEERAMLGERWDGIPANRRKVDKIASVLDAAERGEK